MKYNKWLGVGLVATLVFSACRHDLDYKEGYDIPSYFYGSDPNMNYLGFPEGQAKSVLVPMIGDYNLWQGEDKTQDYDVAVRFVRPLTADDKLTGGVPTELPEVIAKQYPGYKLGAAEILKEAQLAVEAGKLEGRMAIKFGNLGLAKGKTLVPVAFQSETGQVNFAPDASVFKFIIEPQQMVTFPAGNVAQAFIVAQAGGTSYMPDEPNENLKAKLKSELGDGYSVRLKRYDNAFDARPASFLGYQLAPSDIFVEQEFVDLTANLEIPISLQNYANITANKKYLLPLKLEVMKDGKVLEIDPEALETFYVDIVSPTNFLYVSSNIPGAIASNKDASTGQLYYNTITATTDDRYYYLPQLLDNSASNYMYVYSPSMPLRIDIDFGDWTTPINGLTIRMPSFGSPKQLTLYISEDGQSYTKMYENLYMSGSDRSLSLKAAIPFRAQYLRLVTHSAGVRYYGLSELEFYQ